MSEHVTLWNGKPLADYSKDELIGIVEELGRMLHSGYQQAHHEGDMIRAVRQHAMQKISK